MGYQQETPFESIESAQEYLRLLGEEVARVLDGVEVDREAASATTAGRRLDALRLVCYKLQRLEQHIQASGRILNDLRLLRRLFAREVGSAALSIHRVPRVEEEPESLSA